MRLTRTAVLAGLIFARLYGQTTCISFPSGFVPFSSITYVTAADSAGDHLVVGVPAPGALSFVAANIPAPAFTNQTFCDPQVQLAPQQFYPNVYVPTAGELSGNFSAFSGLLTIPGTSQPFPNGIIPESLFGSVFAWRIGPAQAGSANGGWSPTGSMTEARGSNAVVVLPGGKVLVVSSNDTSADIYDPTTGTFEPTGRMLYVHGSHQTGTLLSDGRVLIVGGTVSPSASELYDPSSGQFLAAAAPAQPHGYFHTATLLGDGRVLVIGGLAGPNNPGPTDTTSAGAEIYNPQTDTFSTAGAMFANRTLHTATLLADGRVLVAGGFSFTGSATGSFELDSAELYDPPTGHFSSTSPMTEPRASHFAVLLPSAWPIPIVVDVVDDCGNAFNTGSVIVSFTDGDPPISLLSTGNGDWAGTWVPVVTSSGITVRADAQALPLTGTVQVTGAVSTNQGVPVVSSGGVVSSGDFASAPALGLLVSIFGTGLADAAVSAPLPLPQQLGTTSVLLSGGEQLPLLYAADNVINVQIPYDAAVNSTQQLVVQHGSAVSVPVPIAIFTASPSILSANGTGSGRGHVYVIGAGAVETQANANAPATAGNPVVIYCVGLGAITPPVPAGAVVPGTTLSYANAPVTVTFGNQTVTADFAGLTPGLAGLYQVNATVPPGVTPGNQVPVTISVGGKSSSGSIYIAIR